MKKRIAIIFFLLFFAWFWLYTKWAFWEPKEFEKGSWAYISKVPKDIKEFEVIKPDSAVKYSFHMADGLKNEMIVKKYHSKESLVKLKYYFKGQNLVCESHYKYKYTSCSGNYKEMSHKKIDLYVSLALNRNNIVEIEMTFTIFHL